MKKQNGSFSRKFKVVSEYKNRYKVMCGCGKTKYYKLEKLKTNPKCSCEGDFELTQDEYALRMRYVRGALNRGYLFNLTNEKFHELIHSNCSTCGKPPGTTLNKLKYTGIDRLENTEGYTESNSSPCCFNCNRAKSNLGFVEFDDWVDDLVRYRIKTGHTSITGLT